MDLRLVQKVREENWEDTQNEIHGLKKVLLDK